MFHVMVSGFHIMVSGFHILVSGFHNMIFGIRIMVSGFHIMFHAQGKSHNAIDFGTLHVAGCHFGPNIIP